MANWIRVRRYGGLTNLYLNLDEVQIISFEEIVMGQEQENVWEVQAWCIDRRGAISLNTYRTKGEAINAINRLIEPRDDAPRG